jgi:hypothetical protein
MKAMVSRNLKQPHEFNVLGSIGLRGWWNKIGLFKPGQFTGRVIYIDLDCLITGPLDELVESKGIIDMRSWGFPERAYNSSVMVFDAGEHKYIWRSFDSSVPDMMEGDQDWISRVSQWKALPAHAVRSYRYHCLAGMPQKCSVIVCHGKPKPHEIPHIWARNIWRGRHR